MNAIAKKHKPAAGTDSWCTPEWLAEALGPSNTPSTSRRAASRRTTQATRRRRSATPRCATSCSWTSAATRPRSTPTARGLTA